MCAATCPNQVGGGYSTVMAGEGARSGLPVCLPAPASALLGCNPACPAPAPCPLPRLQTWWGTQATWLPPSRPAPSPMSASRRVLPQGLLKTPAAVCVGRLCCLPPAACRLPPTACCLPACLPPAACRLPACLPAYGSGSASRAGRRRGDRVCGGNPLAALQTLLDAVEEVGGTFMLTADHGNAEDMVQVGARAACGGLLPRSRPMRRAQRDQLVGGTAAAGKGQPPGNPDASNFGAGFTSFPCPLAPCPLLTALHCRVHRGRRRAERRWSRMASRWS